MTIWLWSLVVGCMIGGGIYLILERHILQYLFGLVLLSSGINLIVFINGRLQANKPPLVPSEGVVPIENITNPLPQALVLTAIVIGFGLLMFTLILFYKSYQITQNIDTNEIGENDDK